ncbi:hypothetical protein ABVT39_026216 [Epinephelus coioides]
MEEYMWSSSLWTPKLLWGSSGSQSAARLPPKGNDNCMRGSGSSSSSSQHRERCGLWRAESSGGLAESATQLRMFEAGVSGDQRWPLFHPETCSSCENKTRCQSL